MNPVIEELQAKAGLQFLDYQIEALEWAANLVTERARTCLYYKTGAGKSITSLAMLAVWGYTEAVVITPPSTYDQWHRFADLFGITITTMSHSKFREKETRLSRHVAVIADEMHLFGGNTGKGWTKLDRMARHLEAPVILCSATPNYNDAERCYCIKHILDPQGTRGGFLEFIAKECDTVTNPFSMTPTVTGFKFFASAAEYLSSLPGVHYLADDLVFTIVDDSVPVQLPPAHEEFGYNERDHRIIASIIEEKHVRIFQTLVGPDGFVYDHVYDKVMDVVDKADTPVLVFCEHATVAQALAATLDREHVRHGLVTGALTTKRKQEVITKFKMHYFPVLVGTASLATGTDGLDKMCDWLIILDDTEDPAKRRQLIGRIMPRGLDTDASGKHVYRVLQQ